MELDAFVADSVVAVDGKLYAQGAGWNVITTPQLPVRHARIGLGLIIHVPYTATNTMHRFDVRLDDSDGGRVALGDAPPGAPVGRREDVRRHRAVHRRPAGPASCG